MSRADLERALIGEVAVIARLLSEIECMGGLDPELMDELFRRTGEAWVIGVTGTPGAGKSTLVNRLIGWVRSTGRTAAVLAVDPSSPVTGGAVLGDRVRMTNATDPGVFVRSMASRGHVGGLALAAPAAVRLLDAVGTDVIFVETVGVGQNEVEIATVADCVVLVISPGAGDAVQAMKAGVLEIGDVFVVNKSDLPGARETRSHIASALRIGRQREHIPEVLLTSSESGEGFDRLFETIEEHIDAARTSSATRTRALERLRREVIERAAWTAWDRMRGLAETAVDGAVIDQLARREHDPATIAAGIVDEVLPRPS